MHPKRIHLVFKTHLDIGFTDHASKVRQLYHERFIPQAIATAQHFFAEDPEAPKFIWTTGAWLIWDYLNSRPREEVARLETAIERGLVRWHGLPFTTHSELMSPALFRAGLSYSAELDRRFGRTTIAAKMTDVPGHTLGIVPLMAEAGLKFLHIGVNTACPPPDVPDVFRWRAPSGEEIVVMYQRSYGETHLPDGLDEALSFAHTADNIGPQAIHQTVEIHREMQAAYPDAELCAATVEDYGAILWSERERFPVIDCELGDSWIHGAASDPQKLARFRALQRLYDAFETEGLNEPRRAFGRGLTLVAEHTWGVDIKTFLRDETAWDRPAFEEKRKSDFRFSYTEASWAEQRAYLDEAVQHLGSADRERSKAAFAETQPPPSPQQVAPAAKDVVETDGWRVRFHGQTGDVVAIEAPGGGELSTAANCLFCYRHESYDQTALARHLGTYLIDRPEWAILDHDKPGLAKAGTARDAVWVPSLKGTDGGASLILSMPDDACDLLGAPDTVEYRFAAQGPALEVCVILRGKKANRMPEAGFVTFAPAGAQEWQFLKTGLWLQADDVAAKGGGGLQAVFGARAALSGGGEIEITPLDAALVGPVGQDFMSFPENAPSYAKGLRFNLYNNKWGTNFPMWAEGDFMARFRIEI